MLSLCYIGNVANARCTKIGLLPYGYNDNAFKILIKYDRLTLRLKSVHVDRGAVLKANARRRSRVRGRGRPTVRAVAVVHEHLTQQV